MSGEYEIAGSIALYERENEKEVIKIPGPIKEDISIHVTINKFKREFQVYNFYKISRFSLDKNKKPMELNTSTLSQQIQQLFHSTIGNLVIGQPVQQPVVLVFNKKFQFVIKKIVDWSMKRIAGQMQMEHDLMKKCVYAMKNLVQLIGGLDHGNHVQLLVND